MKYGSDEWYLYHDIDNEKPVIPLTFISILLIFCNPGIRYAGIIGIWIGYFLWAHANNEKLNHDPNVLRYREAYNDLRRKGIIK